MSRLKRADMTCAHWSRGCSKESPVSDSYERNSSRALLIRFGSQSSFGGDPIRSDQFGSGPLLFLAFCPPSRRVTRLDSTQHDSTRLNSRQVDYLCTAPMEVREGVIGLVEDESMKV